MSANFARCRTCLELVPEPQARAHLRSAHGLEVLLRELGDYCDLDSAQPAPSKLCECGRTRARAERPCPACARLERGGVQEAVYRGRRVSA